MGHNVLISKISKLNLRVKICQIFIEFHGPCKVRIHYWTQKPHKTLLILLTNASKAMFSAKRFVHGWGRGVRFVILYQIKKRVISY